MPHSSTYSAHTAFGPLRYALIPLATDSPAPHRYTTRFAPAIHPATVASVSIVALRSQRLQRLDHRRPLARAGDVHPGADVYVLFEGDSGFYPAQVVSVDGDQVVAAWADGSGETTVAVGQVVVDTRGMGQALEAASANPTLYLRGQRLGEYEAGGKVWLYEDGVLRNVGSIEDNGEVWAASACVGHVDGAGKVWVGTSEHGEVTAEGQVWRNDDGLIHQVGEIDEQGGVWLGGEHIGEAPGVPRAHAASIYFFHFLAWHPAA